MWRRRRPPKTFSGEVPPPVNAFIMTMGFPPPPWVICWQAVSACLPWFLVWLLWKTDRLLRNIFFYEKTQNWNLHKLLGPTSKISLRQSANCSQCLIVCLHLRGFAETTARVLLYAGDARGTHHVGCGAKGSWKNQFLIIRKGLAKQSVLKFVTDCSQTI